MIPSRFCRPPIAGHAFTLVELLGVIALIAVLATATVPVVAYLSGGGMGMVESKVQGLLEGSRQFALANRTYVRVGFAQTDNNGEPSIVIQCIHSATGDLRNDDADALGNENLWRSTDKPTVLSGIQFEPALAGRLAGSDATVNALEENFPPFTRRSGSRIIDYRYIIQFDPLGQISIEPNRPTRSAVIGLSNPRKPSDPVGLVLSGLSGRIQTFRQEDLTR